MKIRLLSLLLALAMLLSLTACGGDTRDNPPSSPSAETAENRIFTDDLGRDVEIPSQITRIVPSGSLAQIVLFAIAPEMFVGLASRWKDSAQGIISEEYYDLPYLGHLYSSADLNIEELALADPQIIIDIGEPKDSAAEDLDALEAQTSIPSVFLSATLETMPETYRTLGRLLDKEEKGEALAQFCEQVYMRTLAIMEEVGDNKVKALYILGEEGLNVLARDSYHAELMDLLTDNIAEVVSPTSKGTGNEVSMEQLSLWDPDFILFAPDSIYSEVSEMDTWDQISAVANGRYVEVPEGPHNWMGSPPAVQRYLGLVWLPAVLYPDYCDYDVTADILEYYELFYGCRLTDQQYETLTANAFLK